MKRFISAIIIGFLLVYSICDSAALFIALMCLICVCMLYEWKLLVSRGMVRIVGNTFILQAILCLVYLRLHSSSTLLWYFTCIWSMDTFAMLGGRMIGGPKFAPQISPNKTWAGVIVGCIASECITSIPLIRGISIPLLSTLIGFVSQLSDITISYFKRKKGVKDTNTKWTTIPGHGGFLDRFDSIILSAPVFILLTKLFGLV